MKRKVLILILLSIIGINLVGCVKDNQKNLEINIEDGLIEKITVDNLVVNFNKELLDNKELNQAINDYLQIIDKVYVYELYTGITLNIYVQDFYNDSSKEIVDYMIIKGDKKSEHINKLEDYTKILITANNEKLESAEVSYLYNKAKNRETRGKGIAINYNENNEFIEYKIIRLYE